MNNYFEERLEKILDNLDTSDLKYPPDLDLVRQGLGGEFLHTKRQAQRNPAKRYVEDAEIRNMLTREFRKNKVIETKNKHVNSYFEGIELVKEKSGEPEQEIKIRQKSIENLMNINEKHYESLKDTDKITFKNLELFARLWAYYEISSKHIS